MREFPVPGRGQSPPRKRGKVIPFPAPKVAARKRTGRMVMVALGLVLGAAIGGQVYLIAQRPLPAQQPAAVEPEEKKILDLVNVERARAGLAPLKISRRLTAAARGHSYDMAWRGYFSHLSADGIGPAQRIRGSGVQYAEVGENIYEDDYTDHRLTAQRAVQAWMQSPGHRQNMLSPRFDETGIGAVRTADGATYVTEDFVKQ
jgi:uncharacterized protein YkwD